jgi:hypothetical protein
VLSFVIPMAASDSVKAEQWFFFVQNQSSSKIIKFEAKKELVRRATFARGHKSPAKIFDLCKDLHDHIIYND